jgi:uncharacterized protein (TIGR03663 family)
MTGARDDGPEPAGSGPVRTGPDQSGPDGEGGVRVRAVRVLGRPTRAVPLLVVLALALRLPLLDARPAHWDEARVGWWILRYRATGTWEYYPILHGPFLFHVERWLFDLLGPSDAVMRLPVAVVGGLFPASALWYRDHLDDSETVALAGLLAAVPLLVFYSRFMRNDLLVAAFAFASFGALLRLRRTGRRRYLFAAALLLALAVAAKENAVLYLLSWAGGGALVASWSWRAGDPPAADDVSDQLAAVAGRWWPSGLLAALAWLSVVVWFYAPRTRAPASGFDDLASHPGLLPDLVRAATVDVAGKVVDLWVFGDLGSGSYPLYFGLLVGLLVVTAPTTLALAGYGAARERGRASGPRWLVRFAVAWAGLGVLGYPAAVDVVAGWTLVHVVVPLTIPAAVGLAALVERARPAFDGQAATPRSARAATAVLVVLSFHVAGVGGTVNYAAPADHWNPYPQPAQPDGALRTTGGAVGAIAAGTDGPTVAYVGPYFAEGLLHRLPFPWYARAAGGSSIAVASADSLDDPPPVVVAPAGRHGAVAPKLDGYVCVAHRLSPWTDRGPGVDRRGGVDRSGPRTHVYVERAALDRYYGSTLSSQRCG